jgi:hypothetical protein
MYASCMDQRNQLALLKEATTLPSWEVFAEGMGERMWPRLKGRAAKRDTPTQIMLCRQGARESQGANQTLNLSTAYSPRLEYL